MSTTSRSVCAGLAATLAIGAAIPYVVFPIGRIIAIGLLVIGLVMSRDQRGSSLLSPIWIITIGYLGLALGGVLFYQRIVDTIGGAAIRIDLTGQQSRDTFWLLIASTTTFLVSATIVSHLLRPIEGESTVTVVRTTARVNSLILNSSVLPPILTVLTIGPAQILHRNEYLASASGSLQGIGVNLATAGSLGLGYLLTQRPSVARLFAIWVLIGCYGMLFLSLGTRRLALLPILIAGGAYAGSRSRRAAVCLALSVALGAYLVQLPLYLRGSEEHGLLPYAAALPDFLMETLHPDVVGQTVLISYGTIGATAFKQPAIPARDFVVSLNPAPGGWSGWYRIADRHRLNPFTPYPALGELGNSGAWAVAAYYSMTGALVAYLERRIRSYLAQGRPLIPLAILGLLGLFVLYSLQYNLRSSTRLLLYALLVDICARSFHGLFRARKQWTTGSEPDPNSPLARANR